MTTIVSPLYGTPRGRDGARPHLAPTGEPRPPPPGPRDRYERRPLQDWTGRPQRLSTTNRSTLRAGRTFPRKRFGSTASPLPSPPATARHTVNWCYASAAAAPHTPSGVRATGWTCGTVYMGKVCCCTHAQRPLPPPPPAPRRSAMAFVRFINSLRGESCGSSRGSPSSPSGSCAMAAGSPSRPSGSSLSPQARSTCASSGHP